jgi:hypothetical protein
MKPVTFFNIVLKLFGLYFIKEAIIILPQIIFSLFLLTTVNNVNTTVVGEANVTYIITSFCTVLIYLGVAIFLFLRFNYITEKIKLKDGIFEEPVFNNLSEESILNILLFLLGGFIVFNELPNLCKNIFNHFQVKKLNHSFVKPDYSFIILSTVKVLIGIIILTVRKEIVQLFKLKEKNQKIEAE